MNTRRTFLRSLLSVVVALPVVGRLVDREKLARRWLVANGFEIDEREFFYGWSYMVAIKNAGAGATWIIRTKERIPIASEYMRLLAAQDFVIEEKHLRMELSAPAETWDGEWPLVEMRHVETAPPTIHRFARPWWI